MLYHESTFVGSQVAICPEVFGYSAGKSSLIIGSSSSQIGEKAHSKRQQKCYKAHQGKSQDGAK